MILRRVRSTHRVISMLLLLHAFAFAAEDDSTFDCLVTSGSLKYDLTTLAGEHTVSRTRSTPPTSMVDTVRFDLCKDLSTQDGVGNSDQCPSGTRVCLTKTNKRGEEGDRIVSVIPIAQTSSLEPSYSSLSSPKGLNLILHGGSYPDPSTSNSTPQSLNLTLLCSTETSDPKFTSYDGARLELEWSAPAGCGFSKETAPPDSGGETGGNDDAEKEKESVGSGVGWFFLVLLLAFAAYFALGAYYNYSTYGASGADLIPHRDFWKEVPYMFNDVVQHLCSTVRPRRISSNRGGYIAV